MKTDLRSLQERVKRYKLLKKSGDTKGRMRSLKYTNAGLEEQQQKIKNR